MSFTTFPASLPQPNMSGFREYSEKNFLEDRSDMGVAGRRATSTKRLRRFSASYTLTSDQKDTLDSYYETTLKFVSPFYWVHPSTSEIILVCLQDPPSYEPAGWRYWNTTLVMCEL